MNWESELYGNVAARIEKLSPGLSVEDMAESVDAATLEEAEKLQQKYGLVYRSSDNPFAYFLSPGVHSTLAPLFTEYPTGETETNSVAQAAMDGLSTGFSAGLWSEASKGIYPKASGEAVTTGAGETTLADWADNTEELAKTSPVKIPENATIKSGTKAAGYDQISYKWAESGYNYEARWHTKTPGAPAGQGNTWVITRVALGTSTGSARTVYVLAGDEWVTRYEWQAAINAYRNGVMTAAQEAMLKAGHWLAP